MKIAVGTACSYCAGSIAPVFRIARSTSSRRAIARSGWWNGSYVDGAWVSPASSADSFSDSLRAGFEKYVRAAASTPYAWLP